MTAFRFLYLAVGVAAVTFAFFGVQGNARAAETTRTPLLDSIREAQATTWRYDRIMGRKLTRSRHGVYRNPSQGYRRWLLSLWQARAEKARLRAMHPPHEAAWLCIHRREGPWRANTGNGYYGGLQMDVSFQRTYGRYLLRTKGYAHRWTSIEQMWVAERAHRSGRGFHPWPNTARSCGLL
jgi:transglycosylase-like protein